MKTTLNHMNVSISGDYYQISFDAKRIMEVLKFQMTLIS